MTEDKTEEATATDDTGKKTDDTGNMTDDTGKKTEDAFQKKLGLTMALVATVFSITGWAANKYGSAQSGAEQKIAYMHDWYNTKGIKQNLAEGQRDLLTALLESGTISSDKVKTLEQNIAATNANIVRYKKEKAEMTLGSKTVGRENWAQEIDGKLGLVIGTKELELKVASLEPALGRFQLSYLFFQFSLFAGSVSLMNSNLKMKRILYWILVCFAGIAVSVSVNAWLIAKAVV